MQEKKPIFSRLQIEGWRQIDSVDIELHPRLTIITGANGAGKSTLLTIFTKHFGGWNRQYLSTPKINSGGPIEYMTGWFNSIFKKFNREKEQSTDIGTLWYSTEQQAHLVIPVKTSVQYEVSINGQQSVDGFHIDSHRSAFFYQQVQTIPTNAITAQMAYSQYSSELHQRYSGGNSNNQPIYKIKEAIISMATFGEGNTVVHRNEEVLKAYLGFIEALRNTLPDTLGFIDLSIRMPEIVVVTKTGEFMLDSASGGLMTLIDMTFRLHMFSLDKESFVVTMDEPENHLHPTMQRSLMKRLLAAFPKAQFIVATHSPFIVSSVRDSHVYALRYKGREEGEYTEGPTAKNRVVSEKLDTINRAGNAGEILREVLGVSSTMPEWVDDEIQSLVERYAGKDINQDILNSLRSDLTEIGQAEFYPDALAKLLNTQ